jgi:TolB-like protein/DNA-binding winged helix-turn-helix (wHTH) protein/lipoprotein NlpI
MISESTKVQEPIRFGEDFELDLFARRLRRGSHRLKIERIPLEILSLLVERPGEIITRDEIVTKVWGKGAFLDTDNSVRGAIRKIRLVLKDDPEQPRFIQTVTGQGYRFIAPLISSPAENRADVASEVEEKEQKAAVRVQGDQGFRMLRAGLWFALAAALVMAIIYIAAKSRPADASALKIKSLAVLPFANLSGDPGQDYFSDGVTDELITMLAKNPGLRIISRTSVMRYQKVKRPLPEIARELGVDGILEGSAGRFGTRVHINVQLIFAPTDTHIWAESYDRDSSDVVSLQSELAQTIARQVGLSASASPRSKRMNPEAHDAYLMGRYYWFAGNFDKSLEQFQKAVALQPDYAAAWSGIADSYIASAVGGDSPTAEAVENGEPAAQKALALDESAAEAHVTMAAVNYFLHWDLANADRESRRAIEINPRFAEAHNVRSLVLLTLRRPDEALQQEREVMELDPFAQPEALARVLIHARKFDAAIAEARLRNNAQSDNAQLHDMLKSAYMHKGGMAKEAAEEWEAELQLYGDKQGALAVHQAFVRGGLKAVHEWQLSEFTKRARTGYVAKLDLAAIYAHLRRKEEALHYLELAYQEHEALMVTVQNMPSFDFLHSEPRYQAIVKKMGLPAEQ